MTIDTLHAVSTADIVEMYLSFFQAHGHTLIPGSPLVMPGGDTSFVIAGMQPLLPYLRGQQAPPASRLTNLQRCLRTNDAEGVGINDRNLTSFLMLGNWSIDDYGKREAITMAFDFLLNVLRLDREQLWVTTFEGDPGEDLLADDVVVEEWRNVGMPRERIVPLGADDNLWTMGGGPGPCGPCTEIFVDRGEALGCGQPTCRPGCSCERFLEIWNLVFLEYERLPDGSLVTLPFLSVDTGMGLERIALVLQGVRSAFDIDLFSSARIRLREIISGDGLAEERAQRMIVDHLRAALFAWLAGVGPGRDGRSSVVRRLLRRAARQGRLLGIERSFLGELVMPLVEGQSAFLTSEERTRVLEFVGVVTAEEERFARVLTLGLRHLARLESDAGSGLVPGEALFDLLASHGFPTDLAGEILAERGLTVDWSGYERAQEAHREVSRVSAARHFQDNVGS